MSLPERSDEATKKPRRVHYRVSDGKPMAETDQHRDEMIDEILAVKLHYRRDPTTYVSGNNFVYYEEGNPKKCISPDGYVVFGVGARQRDCYKVWEEGGRMPDVAFEFTSKKTQAEDRDKKLLIYQEIFKVKELYYFDPTGDYLKPIRLLCWRRREDSYEIVLPENGRIHSEALGLDLVIEGERLRFYDPKTGKRLPNFLEAVAETEEEVARRQEAEQQAMRESQARQEAEQQALRESQARQEAELRALRESQARQEAEQRALRESRARQELEEELQRLRQEIEALRRQSGG